MPRPKLVTEGEFFFFFRKEKFIYRLQKCQQVLCEGLTEMKKADFHTEGVTFILIKDTVLLILQLMDEWALLPQLAAASFQLEMMVCSHFPVLSSEQEKAVISHTIHSGNSMVPAH